MDKETIESLFYRLKMEDSLGAFKAQDIDLDLLLELSEEDLKDTLKEMKLTIGKQRKVCLEVKNLKTREKFIFVVLFVNSKVGIRLTRKNSLYTNTVR